MFACKYVGFACRIMAILFGCNVCEWGRRARVRGAALFTYRCMFVCKREQGWAERLPEKDTHDERGSARAHKKTCRAICTGCLTTTRSVFASDTSDAC